MIEHYTKIQDVDVDEIVRYTKNDKKVVGDKIKFILIKKIGEAYIDMDVSYDDMKQSIIELLDIYETNN